MGNDWGSKIMAIRYYPLMILFLAGMILPFFPGMYADREEGTITINEGEHWSLLMDMDDLWSFSYTVSVTNGPNVDIVFFNSEEYENYKNGTESEYLGAGTNLNTSHVIQEELNYIDGTFYLVIDNTDYGNASPSVDSTNDPATIEFEIDFGSETEGEGGTLGALLFIFGMFCGIIVLPVVIVVIVIGIIKYRDKY
jgi:hypothetical protein